jgi:hypothetical protein
MILFLILDGHGTKRAHISQTFQSKIQSSSVEQLKLGVYQALLSRKALCETSQERLGCRHSDSQYLVIYLALSSVISDQND